MLEHLTRKNIFNALAAPIKVPYLLIKQGVASFKEGKKAEAVAYFCASAVLGTQSLFVYTALIGLPLSTSILYSLCGLYASNIMMGNLTKLEGYHSKKHSPS